MPIKSTWSTVANVGTKRFKTPRVGAATKLLPAQHAIDAYVLFVADVHVARAVRHVHIIPVGDRVSDRLRSKMPLSLASRLPLIKCDVGRIGKTGRGAAGAAALQRSRPSNRCSDSR